MPSGVYEVACSAALLSGYRAVAIASADLSRAAEVRIRQAVASHDAMTYPPLPVTVESTTPSSVMVHVTVPESPWFCAETYRKSPGLKVSVNATDEHVDHQGGVGKPDPCTCTVQNAPHGIGHGREAEAAACPCRRWHFSSR